MFAGEWAPGKWNAEDEAQDTRYRSCHSGIPKVWIHLHVITPLRETDRVRIFGWLLYYQRGTYPIPILLTFALV